MTKPKRYKRYSAEFKREALRRAAEEQMTVKAVCEELGISTRLYLAVVMDLFSRRIVGWSMSHRMGRHLVVSALRTAIDARRPDGPLIHQSDRGVQYTSDDFREELARHGVECSMSAAANCYDCEYGIAA